MKYLHVSQLTLTIFWLFVRQINKRFNHFGWIYFDYLLSLVTMANMLTSLAKMANMPIGLAKLANKTCQFITKIVPHIIALPIAFSHHCHTDEYISILQILQIVYVWGC